MKTSKALTSNKNQSNESIVPFRAHQSLLLPDEHDTKNQVTGEVRRLELSNNVTTFLKTF